jgi:amino acid adenylation domain-containing protein
MVGVFINTLPVRVQFDPEEPVLGWLKRMQGGQAQASRFEHAPLVEIQRWSEIERGTPLFESLAVFENYSTDSYEERYGEGNGKPLGRGLLDVQVLKTLDMVSYPLALVIAPGEEMELKLEYHAERFTPNAIERLLEQLRMMLLSIAAGPQQRVGAVSWISPEERRQVAEEWNQTQAELPALCVHQLFEGVAEKTPQAAAVECQGRRLTYAELNQRANQLAWRLRNTGAGPESRVGVYLDRTENLVVALLAVLKAGAVYVPLDPNYPLDRLSFMMKDAGLSVLLTESRLVESLAAFSMQPEIIKVDEDGKLISREQSCNPPVNIAGRNLAYVMYTSGSTGLPKGVLIEHHGMLNHLSAKISDLKMSAKDVVAETAPSSFDISVWQILAVLLAGGRVCIIEDELAKDGLQLLREIQRTGVTIVQTVPALLQMMVAEDGKGHPDLPQLRWMISNAEALPIALCESWKEKYPQVPLLNAYGPTECSDDISHYHVSGEKKAWPMLLSAGH